MQIDLFGRLAARMVRCDRLVAVCRNCAMDLAKNHRRLFHLFSFILYEQLCYKTSYCSEKKKTWIAAISLLGCCCVKRSNKEEMESEI